MDKVNKTVGVMPEGCGAVATENVYNVYFCDIELSRAEYAGLSEKEQGEAFFDKLYTDGTCAQILCEDDTLEHARYTLEICGKPYAQGLWRPVEMRRVYWITNANGDIMDYVIRAK